MILKKAHYETLNCIGYKAIAGDVIITETGLTAVYEVHTSQLDTEDNMQARHALINRTMQDLPPDSAVQIYMTKLVVKPNLAVTGRCSIPIIKYIDEKRTEKINNEPAPMYRCYMAITMPVKTAKNADRNEDYANVKRRMELFTRQMWSTFEGTVLQLNSAQIPAFISHYLNHIDARTGQSIDEITTTDFNIGSGEKGKPGYVYYGGNYHTVFGLRPYGEKSRLPEYSWSSINNIWHHSELKDSEFTIVCTIEYPAKDKTLGIAVRRKNMISGRQAVARNFNMKWMERTPEGININELRENVEEAIMAVETSQERFVNWQYRAIVWGKSLPELEKKAENVMAVVGTTHKFMREKLNIRGAFFGSFPGCSHLDAVKIMVPSYNAEDYLPVDLPRKTYDNGKAGTYLYYYGETGELMRYDLFDKRAAAWNGIVCGGSGSGKSFLVNDILYQFLAQYDGQVAICDYGGAEAGSYRNLVANTGGTYLEINFDNTEFSINPFEGRLFDEQGELIAIKFTSLMATLERMMMSRDSTLLSSDQRFELQAKLRQYYKDRGNNEGNGCSLNDFAHYIKDEMPDLYRKMFEFVGIGGDAGPYARFFRGKSELPNKKVVCFDMAGLKGHETLKNVLVPALLDTICNDILGEMKDKKKMLIMDEAWQDLSRGGQMQDFIEEMYRTIRKLGGTCYVITQRFEDVLDSNIGGALAANTSYFYFVGNRHNPQPLLTAESGSANGTVRLTEYDIDAILNSAMKRDCYLMTPFFCGKMMFNPCNEFCVLATTDPDDKVKIRRAQAKLGVNYVTPEVVELVKGEL